MKLSALYMLYRSIFPTGFFQMYVWLNLELDLRFSSAKILNFELNFEFSPRGSGLNFGSELNFGNTRNES